MRNNAIDGPLLAMVEGRFARIDINVTDLGTQDDVVSRFSTNIPVNLPNAFILPNGRPAHLQCRGGQVFAWTELDKLRLHTVWTVGADGGRYPLFKKQEQIAGTPEHMAAFDFEPAVAGMRLYFTSTLQWDPGNKRYNWLNSYLIAKAPKRKEIFRPPLPNIFSDSRLCMGTGYTHHGPCLADVFSHSLSHLDSSMWNSDAMEGLGGDHIRAIYTFKDNKQVAPVAGYKWWDQPVCKPVNLLCYGELPLV